QVETGLVDWVRDHGNDELDIGGTALKVGVTDRLHLELDLPAYVHVRHGPSGLGDSAVALKYRLTNGSAPVQVAVRPFVKTPTAKHSLGNGKAEGGIALLADSTFGKSSVGWDIAPEMDLVADSDGSGYHVATTAAASVGVPLSSRLTISGEVWGAWDFDPAGTARQYSIDGAVAYLVSRDVQLDAGANFGLNRNTPGVELYTGIAFRF
ncbi:MAG TPA: transporter, partial [Sphingomicrobium sp.]|nr:transporter [Sphingomicrobium sp.]